MKEIIQRIVNYSQKQYITVLVLLAIVLGVNYLIVIDKLKEQEGISILLKMSANQSAMVHTINLLAAEIPYASKKEFAKIKRELNRHKIVLRDTSDSEYFRARS
jgi:hypothetical protein